MPVPAHAAQAVLACLGALALAAPGAVLAAAADSARAAAAGAAPGAAADSAVARPPAPRTLTLDEALGELDARGPSAAQVRSRAEQASALVRQAAAPLLPALTATGSYTQYREGVVFPRSPVSVVTIQPEKAWSVGYALRLPLVIPTAWADLAAARHGATGAREAARAARDGLRLAVVQAAWMGASAEEVLAAADRALATARDQAETARRAVNAGLQPPLSALASETQAVRREGDQVRAAAALERTRLALGVLLGTAEPVRIAPLSGGAAGPGAGPPEAAPSSSAIPALVSEALQRRPEVRAQAEQAATAGSQVTSARLRFLPQLSASGSYFAQDVAYPTGHRDGWRLTLDLSWPLYDGGLRYGKLAEAVAAEAGARAAERQARLQVAQDVEDAARDLEVAGQRLRLAAQQRSLAADAAATARRGFEAGTTGHADVLGANDELFQAEVGLAEARAGAGVSRAALDRAAGRL